jgi:catechol 2,3-dioxygenase-like lactoylglutathione lyase family enzyme
MPHQTHAVRQGLGLTERWEARHARSVDDQRTFLVSLRLVGVELGVGDLAEARPAYALLLGVPGVPQPDGTHRFPLERGSVALAGGRPGRHALRFVADVEGTTVPDVSTPGLEVRVEPSGTETPGGAAPVAAIDHVVIQSPDPDRAIAFWRDRLGLRLALDRPFPDRGLRLVFFRSGGLTLEIAGAHPPSEDRNGGDLIHGVSYRVTDLAGHRERLLGAGLDVSPIRTGMRPGTIVATVRSGTAGVPTLLLQLG